MLIKLKKVYYCDYCKKHSLVNNMAKHEKGCFNNVNRFCRTCNITEPLTSIVNKLKDSIFTFEQVQTELNSKCPTCTLAVIILTGTKSTIFKDNLLIAKKEWYAPK